MARQEVSTPGSLQSGLLRTAACAPYPCPITLPAAGNTAICPLHIVNAGTVNCTTNYCCGGGGSSCAALGVCDWTIGEVLLPDCGQCGVLMTALCPCLPCLPAGISSSAQPLRPLCPCLPQTSPPKRAPAKTWATHPAPVKATRSVLAKSPSETAAWPGATTASVSRTMHP